MANKSSIEAKTKELEKGLQNIGTSVSLGPGRISIELASQIVKDAISLTPPTLENFMMEAIVMSPGGGRAKSIKPGNIRFDLLGLFDALATGSQALRTMDQADRYTVILIAIRLVATLKSLATISLSENEATVYWTLFTEQDDGVVATEGLLVKVNKDRGDHGYSPLSELEMCCCLERLTRIGAVRESGKEGTAWTVLESLRIIWK